jgi:hypothetical protein
MITNSQLTSFVHTHKNDVQFAVIVFCAFRTMWRLKGISLNAFRI